MKKYAEKFYKGKQWQRCSREYKKEVGGLCERCKAQGIIEAGVIVHHKVRLNPMNISEPKVALNFDNLELLCKACHNKEHESEMKRAKRLRRYSVDESGNLIIKME